MFSLIVGVVAAEPEGAAAEILLGFVGILLLTPLPPDALEVVATIRNSGGEKISPA
ncbi:Uncharacterised protein [Chlamydia trachomatis]|nr:Uncharacterised protein [Chlamydia trachomatis]CRH48549.1 Uncharacterised protein [Chlamydia trachomatis]